MAIDRKDEVGREGPWLWRVETFKPYSGGVISVLQEYEQGDRCLSCGFDLAGPNTDGIPDGGCFRVDLGRWEGPATQRKIDALHMEGVIKAAPLVAARRPVVALIPDKDSRCGWCSGRGRQRPKGNVCENCKGTRIDPDKAAERAGRFDAALSTLRHSSPPRSNGGAA